MKLSNIIYMIYSYLSTENATHQPSLITFRYVQDFETTLLDRNTEGGDISAIVGNPVQAFKLMRRFTVDIPNIEKDLKQDDWKGLCHPFYLRELQSFT